jgi:iron complex transport system ATP-binding protein
MTNPPKTAAGLAGPITLAAAQAAVAARSICVGYEGRPVISGLDLEVAVGSIVGLIGPNGSGKSTLLNTIARLLRPTAGTVLLDGKAITTMRSTEIARRLAILPQSPTAPGTLTVAELVEQGRYPYAGPLRMLRRQDHEAIDTALTLTGMTSFAHRPIDGLSGGERQRAWIALALAQDTDYLLLDEPTTFLDIGHQLEVLELVERLHRERSLTVVMVLHDINQAARFCERVIVMRSGAVVKDGSAREVLTEHLLADVFGVRARIILDDESGRPLCLALSTSQRPADGIAPLATPSSA